MLALRDPRDLSILEDENERRSEDALNMFIELLRLDIAEEKPAMSSALYPEEVPRIRLYSDSMA
jgi:hypothetical protein